MKVLVFATHPIQYQIPIYQKLSGYVDLKVIYLLKQTKKGQADAGFGVEFEWDIPLLEGYQYDYLNNHSTTPSSSTYNGIIINKTELHDLMYDESPDIVLLNGWFPKGLKQIINYCHQHKIKTICRGDSNLMMPGNIIKKTLKEAYIRSILRKITAFFYVGNENKKYYLHYGIKESKLFPAFHCINTPFFQDKFNAIQKITFNKNSINIGFSGKFIDIKNPFLLIDAVSKSELKSKLTIQFIGDGPLKSEIEQYAKNLNVTLHFNGFLNQSEIVEKGYSKIDFLVLPSKSETWGLVINEVMTGGIPVIVSNTVGCNTDLIDESKTGFTFKNGNAIDLANKIDLMIKLLNDDSNKVNKNVLTKIDLYSLENTVKSYMSGIKSVLQPK
ncbi:MAG: glycosyltransferase family 4 protein [Vicingaceae bacterium]|nr:glycosyltransferase family 4 protein [Vicingaceae bacterium]